MIMRVGAASNSTTTMICTQACGSKSVFGGLISRGCTCVRRLLAFVNVGCRLLDTCWGQLGKHWGDEDGGMFACCVAARTHTLINALVAKSPSDKERGDTHATAKQPFANPTTTTTNTRQPGTWLAAVSFCQAAARHVTCRGCRTVVCCAADKYTVLLASAAAQLACG